MALFNVTLAAMRRTTLVLLAALALAGCSDGGGDGERPQSLCDLVQAGELPDGEQPAEGFPNEGGPDEESCEWKTVQGSSLDLTIQEYIPVTVIGEQWKVEPRQIGGRDVYVRASGYSLPGREVIECTAAAQRGSDLLRMRWRVAEPRGDLCAKFEPVLEKIAGRLPA
jgi:hypothetical protein